LRPKIAEILRPKSEQVFADNGYCHSNGKFYCHSNQTGLSQIVVQTKKSIVVQIRSDENHNERMNAKGRLMTKIAQSAQ
jgi:hypothetical protein